MSGVCTNLRQAAMDRQLDASSPGPAAYSSTRAYAAILPVSPRQPIGGAPRSPRDARDGVPGPGEYLTFGVDSMTGRAVSSGRPSSARAVMGRAARPGLSSDAVSPGPAYAPSTAFTLAAAPAFTLPRAGRPELSVSMGGPGPGAYSAGVGDALRPASPRQPMARAPRSPRDARDDVPGPGAFSVAVASFVPGGTMGKAGRADAGDGGADAGPGVAYATTAAFDGIRPRNSAGAIGRAQRWGGGGSGGGGGSPTSPGPGMYRTEDALDAVRPASARAVIGRGPRDGSAGGSPRGARDAPGPGSYSINDGATLPASPRQPMGRAVRPDLSSGAVSPGPAYSPSTAFTLAAAPAFTVPRAGSASRAVEAAPGPADYSADAIMRVLVPASPRQAIGRAQRWSASSSPRADAPGPGAYSLATAGFVAGGSFGKGERPQSASASGGPGPADYGHGAPASRAGVAPFGRSPRSPRDAHDGAPGPADYEVASGLTFLRPQSARAVIGHAEREAGTPRSPAAEVPLYAPVFEAVKPASPRQPIGRAPRFSAGGDVATPGPGAFAVPPSPTGPAFTIRAR